MYSSPKLSESRVSCKLMEPPNSFNSSSTSAFAEGTSQNFIAQLRESSLDLLSENTPRPFNVGRSVNWKLSSNPICSAIAKCEHAIIPKQCALWGGRTP